MGQKFVFTLKAILMMNLPEESMDTGLLNSLFGAIRDYAKKQTPEGFIPAIIFEDEDSTGSFTGIRKTSDVISSLN